MTLVQTPSEEEATMSTWSAGRPYIEGMIEVLGHAGDQPVLRWDGAGTTGGELLAAIYRYARALESLGVARGDLVAMYAPNRPEALALRYATHLLGAASVYLSAPPDPGKRAQMLVDFRPSLVSGNTTTRRGRKSTSICARLPGSGGADR